MNTNPPHDGDNTDHRAVLAELRRKIETVTTEYSNGKLNPAQFNAIYRHYIEKRMIIEKLIERNPESEAWRSVATPGQTGFLRTQFEARVLYYMVFRHGEGRPLITGGQLPSSAATSIHGILKVIWSMNNIRQGLARKAIGGGKWLVLMMGEHGMTLVVFSLQPSTIQINRIRDMHTDFERANHLALKRGLSAKAMVFPQRALIEEG